jgi:cell wall-associated NlpC family hydrolase
VSVQTVARHRAARRPTTPLTAFGQAIAGSAGHVTRRTAVVAASSGLVLTVAAPAAVAAPEPALPQVDVNSLTQQARAALDVSPTVKVSQDAEWTLPKVEVVGEEPPPPPPPPEPEPQPQATTTRSTAATTGTTSTSRSETRSAIAPAPAPASGTVAALLQIARSYVGTPYVYGGATPAGFDCSGFTQYVFAQVGISLPRSSSAQRYAGRVVSASEARAGDLVWGPGHVGIYTGNGNHIAARQPGTALYESQLYFSPIYIRVIG